MGRPQPDAMLAVLAGLRRSLLTVAQGLDLGRHAAALMATDHTQAAQVVQDTMRRNPNRPIEAILALDPVLATLGEQPWPEAWMATDHAASVYYAHTIQLTRIREHVSDVPVLHAVGMIEAAWVVTGHAIADASSMVDQLEAHGLATAEMDG